MSTARDSWSIEELADEVGIPVRTIRYYIAEGMVPGPGTRGKSATYTFDHLQRLRLIRRLVEQRVPLVEIRQLVDRLSAEEAGALLAEDERRTQELRRVAEAKSPAAYVSGLLDRARAARGPQNSPGKLGKSAYGAGAPISKSAPRDQRPQQEVSQEWQRYVLAPGLELHVRRDLAEKYRDIVERILAEYLAGAE